MRIAVIAGLLLLGLGSAGAQQIYKWTDAQGRVHYSSQPPRDVQAEPVRITPPPSARQPQTSPPGTAQQEPAPSTAQDDPAAAHQAAYRENCEIARRNLALLEDESKRRFRIDGGEPVYLTDEERQARIAQAREMIATYCE